MYIDNKRVTIKETAHSEMVAILLRQYENKREKTDGKMMEIVTKDVRDYDTFNRQGFNYQKIEMTDNYSVWEIFKDGVSVGFEVWKNKYSKGKIVRPSDEDFGRYGWYFPKRSERMLQKIRSLV